MLLWLFSLEFLLKVILGFEEAAEKEVVAFIPVTCGDACLKYTYLILNTNNIYTSLCVTR